MTDAHDRDRVHLKHIIQCIEKVESDIAPGVSVLDESRTVRDAVLRNLQVLAEATQQLTAEIKASRPDIPWTNVAGFRNRLVHNYFQINLALVRKVIESHLPALKAAALDMLERLDQQ